MSEELTSTAPARTGAVTVAISDLAFSYGRRPQLADVSLAIREGELCCLLGPNGAGKTTLIRCLLGLLAQDRGTIRILGVDAAGLTARALARRIAYVPQSSTTAFPFSTLDIAVMGRTPHLGITDAPSAADRRAAMAQLERLGIGHLARRPFSKLSGGERQLAMLARALVQEAPVLVLDEPTSALDFGNEAAILAVIGELARAGRSVLMTTHQPDHALAHAHQAVLMREGKIIADGPPAEVVTSDTLSDLYRTPIHVTSVVLPGGAGERRTSVAVQATDGADPRP